MSNPTKDTSKTESKNPVESKADAIASQVKAEIARILEMRQAYHAALSATGPMGLEELARAMGRTVDKMGYPAFAEYSTFVAVAVLQKTDHTSYDRLARIARNAVGTDADRPAMSKDEITEAQKRFLTGTAKGTGNGSKATVKIKAPKAFDVALGGS